MSTVFNNVNLTAYNEINTSFLEARDILIAECSKNIITKILVVMLQVMTLYKHADQIEHHKVNKV